MSAKNSTPSRSFVMLAILVVSSTRVIAGCSGGGATYQTDPAKNGYSETSTLYVADGAKRVGVGVLETQLSPSVLSVELHADSLSEWPTVVMDPPVAAGDHRLSALHATLLAPGKAEPVAIEGVLHVRQIAAPCGTGACGRLDAVLELDAPSTSTGALLSGAATLSYSEELVTETSSNDDGGGGCGQGNNGWAVGSYGGSR